MFRVNTDPKICHLKRIYKQIGASFIKYIRGHYLFWATKEKYWFYNDVFLCLYPKFIIEVVLQSLYA